MRPEIDGFTTWKKGMVDLVQNDQVTLAGVTVKGVNGVEMREMLDRQTAKILEQHGARAFACPKSSAAIHEAGHVVILTVLGYHAVSASIASPDNENWFGYTDCPDAGFNEKATAAEKLNKARNLIAGSHG